ncbi:hypothetical protein BCR37DRAFT_382060 [Protomyces lactucae-debilis]|uniref:Uncharacterized protein n=1 Tax=Protomyces lactucae-debilis TaxID=2754530 RepID=A0A1Y2F6G6_PROLT|nr:uncharacterized protein BCR37DRAFT_382060 [Protomyces lactucae-debilis]ORY79074.1 hypothetical protein BCR37DRAFT_382060 [Protomyces lactucae-debilis]
MAQVAGVQTLQRPLNTTTRLLEEEALPRYTENPAYESTAPPQDVTRQAVRRHEYKVKEDLKRQAKDLAACEKIRPYLPALYAQLMRAVERGQSSQASVGPAALRSAHLREPVGVDITFKLRGIDQKALRRNLPRLLVEYAAAQDVIAQTELATAAAAAAASADRLHDGSMSDAAGAPLLHAQTAPASTLMHESERPAALHRAATTFQSRIHDADRLQVEGLFFDKYIQKIYFSKRFVGMFRKNELGERQVGLGLAFIVFGSKLGLPLCDVITYAALDLPRLALQGITGRQKLTLRM